MGLILLHFLDTSLSRGDVSAVTIAPSPVVLELSLASRDSVCRAVRSLISVVRWSRPNAPGQQIDERPLRIVFSQRPVLNQRAVLAPGLLRSLDRVLVLRIRSEPPVLMPRSRAPLLGPLNVLGLRTDLARPEPLTCQPALPIPRSAS